MNESCDTLLKQAFMDPACNLRPNTVDRINVTCQVMQTNTRNLIPVAGGYQCGYQSMFRLPGVQPLTDTQNFYHFR